jgi:hypothetical protein
MHFATNIVVTVDGDRSTANAIWDAIALVSQHGGPITQSAATYRDSFIRTSIGWKVAQRETALRVTSA